MIYGNISVIIYVNISVKISAKTSGIIYGMISSMISGNISVIENISFFKIINKGRKINQNIFVELIRKHWVIYYEILWNISHHTTQNILHQ